MTPDRDESLSMPHLIFDILHIIDDSVLGYSTARSREDFMTAAEWCVCV